MGNVFTTIVKDVESVAAKIETDLQKVFGNATTWEKIAQGVLTWGGPVLAAALTVEGQPAVAAEVSAVVAKVQTDLAVAINLSSAIGNSTNFTTFVQGIQSDLTNAVSEFKLTGSVATAFTTVANELGTILNAAPAASAAVQSIAAASTANATPVAAAPVVDLPVASNTLGGVKPL